MHFFAAPELYNSCEILDIQIVFAFVNFDLFFIKIRKMYILCTSYKID